MSRATIVALRLTVAISAVWHFGAQLFQTVNNFHKSTTFKVRNAGQMAFIAC